MTQRKTALHHSTVARRSRGRSAREVAAGHGVQVASKRNALRVGDFRCTTVDPRGGLQHELTWSVAASLASSIHARLQPFAPRQSTAALQSRYKRLHHPLARCVARRQRARHCMPAASQRVCKWAQNLLGIHYPRDVAGSELAAAPPPVSAATSRPFPAGSVRTPFLAVPAPADADVAPNTRALRLGTVSSIIPVLHKLKFISARRLDRVATSASAASARASAAAARARSRPSAAAARAASRSA